MNKSKEKIHIFGLDYDNIGYEDLIKRMDHVITNSQKMTVVTPYSEMVMYANRDGAYKKIINSADCVMPDGMGIIVAARLMGTPLKQQTTGVDLTRKIIEHANTCGYKLFFLGSTKKNLMQLSKVLYLNYPKLKFDTFAPPFKSKYDQNDNITITNKISRFNPHFLLVALGSPKQEIWILSNLAAINANIIIGIGGSLEFIAGIQKRAPVILQKLCLEWLYRVIMQPQRIKRQIIVPVFILKILLLIFKKNGK